MKFKSTLLALAILFILSNLHAQDSNAKRNILSKTNSSALLQMSKQLKVKAENQKQKALEMADKKAWPKVIETGNVFMELMGLTANDKPLYYVTNNSAAAVSISTNKLWNGGALGLSLDGTGMIAGEWDGGDVLTTHQEFNNTGSSRVIDKDGVSSTHYHATHVAGTIVAGGVQANSKGMAYNATLHAYDWDNDESEMAAAAAAGLIISNHSYGYIAGWYWNGSAYEWVGDEAISTQEDYNFGFYGPECVSLDNVALNAPFYLICKAAGNDRGDGEGESGHPMDGGATGYDCIGWSANAKNILTVGAVLDVVGGYSGDPADVVMTDFSSWGPTDDGRIKPDVCGNGYNLYSTYDDNNTAYNSISGTSMATPSVTGSLLLLQEHYNETYSQYMQASTLKALAIHTADECGPNPGPDYMFGWGLVNAASASDAITNKDVSSFIKEESLSNGSTYTLEVTATGEEPLIATIVWADPAGTPVAAALDPTNKMLVNDLDLTITKELSSFYPYKLDGQNPSNAATTGDNDIDNVEKVFIAAPVAGTYTIVISHEGTITSGPQDFSLIVTGISNGYAVVATREIENITINSALLNGEVISDNGNAVTERGFVYNTTGNPTTSDTKIQVGNGLGTFSATAGSLSSSTTYYVKAYAINSEGTVYGSQLEFTTECGIFSDLPFTENFDASTNLPTCWRIIDNQGNGQVWEIGTHSSGLSGSTGNYVFLNSDAYGSGNSQNSDLVTPLFDLSAYASINLSFGYYYHHYDGSSATLSYSIDGGSNWTQIQQWTASSTNPAVFNQNIPAVAGKSQVKFKWNYIGEYAYSMDIDDIEISGVEITNDPEPSNHVTNFQASQTGKAITLSWTDATGAQIPQGYLIKASSAGFESITNPTDGIAETDGLLVKNIGAGIQTVSFENLSQLTTYYFKIFPYSNPASANINYKTDGTAPQIEETILLIVDESFGTGTTVNQGLPIEPYYGYTYSQSIYLQSEINTANRVITRIAYQYNGNSAWTDQINIYMGHTEKTAFSSTTDWVPLTSLTQVYSGNLAVTTTPGWIWINLTTPFEYNNTQNLLIAVDENTSGYHASADEFYCTLTTGINRSIMYQNDATNPDPASPPTAFALRTYYPNIQLSLNPLATFNPTGDNLWTNAANWPNNIVPDANYMVNVPAGTTLIIPAGKATAECKDLSLEPLANLSVEGSLSVTGNLLVKSDATGTASLIDNGTLSVTGSKQVQLYLAQNDRYYYVSTPVSGATAAVFGNVATTDLLYYRNTSGSSWERITNPSTGLAIGQGLATKQANAGRTLVFTGSLNTGNKTLTIVNTGDKWNLAGNPYPSPIDWGCENDPATGWTLNNIRNTVYIKHGDNFAIWNSAGDGSQTNGGSRYIPSMQAFWIKSLGDGPVISVDNNARVHNNNLLMKSQGNLCQKIRLKISRESYSDEALIQFMENAETWVDKHDAEKMFATGDQYPQIYIPVENEKLAIASFPIFENIAFQNLGFKTDRAGSFTVACSELESFNPLAAVYLEDKLTNTIVNLMQTPVYSFESGICDNTERFTLYFSDGTSHFDPYQYRGQTGIETNNPEFELYSNQNMVFVHSNKSIQADIQVFNILGSEILKTQIDGTSKSFEMALPGHYFVKITDKNGSFVQKINIP